MILDLGVGIWDCGFWILDFGTLEILILEPGFGILELGIMPLCAQPGLEERSKKNLVK